MVELQACLRPVSVIAQEFMAARVEKGQALYKTWFPPGIQIFIVEGPHKWQCGNPEMLYVTFTPNNYLTTYNVEESEFFKSTAPPDEPGVMVTEP
jgi:hypothetical protein